mgnify:CR=1 FL=1
MTIIGIKPEKFQAKDGTEIRGKTIYVNIPLKGNGEGCAGEKLFLSEAKLSKLEFQPAIGQKISPLYNKYGEVQTLSLLENEVIDYGIEE